MGKPDMTITQAVTRSLAVALVAGSLAAGVPALAQKAEGNGLETKINELHQKLQITPDQETKWQNVVKVMHDNAESSRSQVLERRKEEATMTAEADLNAYADLVELHAKHVRKLAKVFASLYDSMTPDQKKVADQVFREHKQKAADQAAAPAAPAQ
jgi:hypothetical protein